MKVESNSLEKDMAPSREDGKMMAERALELTDEKVNRNSKDSVFVDLFNRPEYLLQLYQALHPEDTVTREEDLTIVTLQSLMLRSRYNDLGFIVSNRLMVLVEAQTRWSYNILVRFLLYISDTYNRYITNNKLDLYGSKILQLPQPELYVLYTGTEDIPDVISFKADVLRAEYSDVDITAKVIRSSREGDIIYQYIAYAKVFDEQIRYYGYTRWAVEETIRICKDENILREYLRMEEVANIMFTEVDMEKQMGFIREEERTEGRAEGRAEGRVEGNIEKAVRVVDNLINQENMAMDRACSIAEISSEDYLAWKSEHVIM